MSNAMSTLFRLRPAALGKYRGEPDSEACRHELDNILKWLPRYTEGATVSLVRAYLTAGGIDE